MSDEHYSVLQMVIMFTTLSLFSILFVYACFGGVF
jgi:hypothetical protein